MYKEHRESVVLENEGQKIFGILHRPIGIEKPPVVLICHGLAGNKTGKFRMYVILSELLARYGIASLRIDFRGSGDSEGDFVDMTLESEVSDALRGFQFLEHSPLVDANRIGVFGRSLGGTVALITASRYKKIKTIVTWAPLADGEQWLEQWKKIPPNTTGEQLNSFLVRINGQIPGREFFKQLMTLSIEKELQLLHHIPFLHIHGEQDAVVLTEHHAVRH